jgi:probable phosphoglycerate mutase
MTVFLVRHGRTAWSAEDRYTGVSDVGLDDAGHAQAAELAAWAATARLTHLVCSPMLRARQTAGGAARAAGLQLRTDDRLREIDFGDAEGRLRTEIDPEALRRFEDDPVAHPFPGGEDPVRAADRVSACLREIPADGRTLVVGHNTLLRLALCSLLGIPLADYRRRLPLFAHGTVTELVLTGSGAALRGYNVPLAAKG